MPDAVPEQPQSPGRLDFLRRQYGAALLAAYRGDTRNAPFDGADAWYREWLDRSDASAAAPPTDEAIADAVFAGFRAADPTRTGACMQWLIRLATAGRLPVEDLPKARETLEVFLAYKRRLPAEQRDLGRHETLGAVWKAIEPFVRENAATSGKDEERRERNVARAESEIILEQDGWTIAIPRTERAAKWWGRGTRWCTAAERDNMFAHYAKDGPLVVVIRPDGAKFQWHGPSKQFMDALDEEADPDSELAGLDALLCKERGPDGAEAYRRRLTVYLSVFPPTTGFHESRVTDDWRAAARQAVFEMGLDFRDLPTMLLDQDFCRAAVRKHGLNLCNVPEPWIDRAMCVEAVNNTPEVLQFVPNDLRDRDLCLRVVARFGAMLPYVPEALRDYEMCAYAIKSMPESVSDVPEHVMYRDFFIDAARRRHWRGEYFRLNVDDAALVADVLDLIETQKVQAPIPPALYKRRQFCLELVRRQSRYLQYVPEPMRDREMCLAAVSQNGQALSKVPEHLRQDREICLAAMRTAGDLLRIVPDHLRDVEMVATAIASNGRAIVYEVPQHMLTADLWLEALRTIPQLLPKVPDEFRTQDFYRRTVENNWGAIRYVPPEALNERMVAVAARQDVETLRFVDPKWISRDLIMELAPRNGVMIVAMLHKVTLDRELYETLVRHQGGLLGRVPLALRDRDMCLMAANQDGAALFFVPEDLRDREMCEKALASNPAGAFKHVPARYLDFDRILDLARENLEILDELESPTKDAVLQRLIVEYDIEAMLSVTGTLDGDVSNAETVTEACSAAAPV